MDPEKTKLSMRMRFSIAAATACFIGVVVCARLAPRGPGPDGMTHLPGETPEAELPVFWSAPRFEFTDQSGRIVSSGTLEGRVWIANFIFTQCTAICPGITAKMAKLAGMLEDPDLRYLSFSVDPENDTPEQLARYATMWRADPGRWHFLRTDPAGLAAVADGMKVFVKPPQVDDPIQHTSHFILVDRKGRVRGLYDSAFSDSLEHLRRDALRLLGRALPASGTPAAAEGNIAGPPRASAGAALFASRGCAACHSEGRVAPDLAACLGRPRELADGRTVIADEAYLRESILDPKEKVVAGYPAMMPAYRGLLLDEDLEALVDHLKSMRASVPSPETVPTALPGEKDLVCGMQVTRSATTPIASHEGRTYVFCNARCRDRFVRKPEKYLKNQAAR